MSNSGTLAMVMSNQRPDQDIDAGGSSCTSRRENDDDQEELVWAALERLPTYERVRKAVMQLELQQTCRHLNDNGTLGDDSDLTNNNNRSSAQQSSTSAAVDVRSLTPEDTHRFIDKNFRVVEEDNPKFLRKIRERLHSVGMEFPKVEIRFKNVKIEAECYVGNRAQPTLWNTTRNIMEYGLGLFGVRSASRSRHLILRDVSGIIKPSRMTLLLGPPSSGKTTLLKALAGSLDPSLKVSGEITYNGHRLTDFVPRKTSAYISQNDVHTPELTVTETLDYSVRFQGVGLGYELLTELARREKQAGIRPDSEVDLFMKATALDGCKANLITEYIIKMLGLEMCKDTLVGDAMIRGISGGQKKRVTTGEMIVGPTKVLLMDEISTGLDSSTAYQIVHSMHHLAHLSDATVLISLLQPDPETFHLFDDVVLISDGYIVYQGPRHNVMDFFETCGFKCPDRKGIADFLQEVTSKKDQGQYWADPTRPYRFIPASEFSSLFLRSFHVGRHLTSILSTPANTQNPSSSALAFSAHTTPTHTLLRASFHREWLLIRRQSFVFVFKAVQIVIVATVASTVFLRSTLSLTFDDGEIYVGAVIFAMVINMFNGFAELSLAVQRLPVLYKQRDLMFYPAWVFTLPNCLLRGPISVLESVAWTVVSYYTVGYAPEPNRFFKHLLVVFLIQQLATAMFRVMAGVCRSMIIANTGGALCLLILFLLGGFIIPSGGLPIWWRWGHWVSPLSYAFNALTTNEFLSPRWMNKLASDNLTPLGVAVLNSFDIPPKTYWYWLGVVALIGFTIFFNTLFTLSLMYLNPLGKPQAVISEEQAKKVREGDSSSGDTSTENSSPSSGDGSSGDRSFPDKSSPKQGMILPFSPLSISFNGVKYFVDMPQEMKEKGVTEDRLQLLHDVTGSFRPGVLTALMGVSGAGKTTLMDVLAGRKTGGYIEGDIRISGYPKKQETFARISGYCEQTDIHSPRLTVQESVIFSAFLRLAKEISDKEKMIFVNEVMELVELNNLKYAIVGIPGVTGLSTEQRKRLTIAVELVANPSIIFMDEPTSGLDARAAAIVMRTVRNTVDTGRTVVCTIHQPSIDIFESFDELLLLKRGGEVIYSGPLGHNSHKVVEYFEAIPGVPKIRENKNPAAWMLEVSSETTEFRLGTDFAAHFRSSSLYQQSKAMVMQLSEPPQELPDLHFDTQYSQSTWGQFKSCLWKQWWTYWRSPDYNLVRYFFTFFAALVLGSFFWQIGTKRENSMDLTMIIGAMYVSVLFVGINNCLAVQPIVAVERTVFYRERAAGMYSALPYAIAQVVAEIPYVLVQTSYYSVMVYAMISFQWTWAKFMWFYFITFFTFLYFTYYGMMTVSITPNHEVAAIFASAFFAFFTLFSGFFIPRSRIPKWWIWYYWICPVAWTVYGLIVSQYGDLEETIKVPGVDRNPAIKDYVANHFGYEMDFMGTVGVVLVAFPVFFAVVFAYCIQKLNFQRR